MAKIKNTSSNIFTRVLLIVLAGSFLFFFFETVQSTYSSHTTLQKEIEKDATGPNLMELFFGSEGSLGIIFEIVFNTCEKPKFLETVLLRSDDIDAVKDHILSPEIKKCISSVEYWDENCQTLIGDSPEKKYFIVIELVSQSEQEISTKRVCS